MSQQQWWVFVNGKKYGPATSQQLRLLADQGKVTAETPVVADGMQTPVAAGRIPGLFNQSIEMQTANSAEQRKPPVVHKAAIVGTRPQLPAMISVSPPVAKSEPRKPAISPLLAGWSLVGILAVCGVTFIVWHSRSRHQAEIAAADAQASKSIANAKAWIAGDSPVHVALIEQELSEVLQNEFTTKKVDAEATLNQVRERRSQLAADSVFDQARKQLDGNQVPEAILLLREYMIDPRGTRRTEAQRLLDEAEVAISESKTQESIASMTDDQLTAAGNSLSPEIPDGNVTHPALKRLRAEIASRHLVPELQRRNDLKIAAEKRLEAERLAALERKRVEEVASNEAAKLTETKRQEEKRKAIEVARRERERNGKLDFDYDKSEYARKRMAEVLKSFVVGDDAEQAVAGKSINGTSILLEISKLYLTDRLSGKDIEAVLAKPLTFKKTVRADYSAREACEEFVSQYGAARCGDTSFSYRWLWNEAKLRMAEDADLPSPNPGPDATRQLDRPKRMFAQAPKEITNSIGMKLVLISGGTFTMGAPRSERHFEDDERQHEVTIGKEYYLGVFEVTQAQYQKVMEANLSRFQGNEVAVIHPKTGQVLKEVDSSSHPVERVAWQDAVQFCERLSAQSEEKRAGRSYRLPTEAEWEYACRAGSKAAYSFGNSEGTLGDHAWYSGNSERKTHAVGQKKANAWGLYDMHGNVWEWCSDWYGVYPERVATDPTGANSGEGRVLRGGGWINNAADCRSALRAYSGPSRRSDGVGFRAAISASQIIE